MYRGATIAVVIPAYNEEELLGPTIRSVPEWVDLVVVVDDRSRDGTAEVIQGNGDPRLVALHLESNLGVGGAILRGYEQALRRGAEVIAVMAGDGQMDPHDLPGLLDPIIDDRADYVKGNRLGSRDLLGTMPLVRIIGNFALSYLTRRATGLDHVHDSQCGYTAIRRDLVARLPLLEVYPRYGFPNDLLGHLALLGARVIDHPVRPVYGPERSGIRIPAAAVTISALLVRVWWRCRVRPPAAEMPRRR